MRILDLEDLSADYAETVRHGASARRGAEAAEAMGYDEQFRRGGVSTWPGAKAAS